MRAVAISGSPRSPSKSRALAELMLRALAQHNCDTTLIDVTMLPSDGLLARAQPDEIDRAIAAVGAAHIVVAATPTYRALYTGALKCLFDLMPPSHLLGKICIPLQTGAVIDHALSLEYGLRPLFASLEGVVVGGIYATDSQFVEGQPDHDLGKRAGAVALAAITLARAVYAGQPGR